MNDETDEIVASAPLVEEPMYVLAILLAILATLFVTNRHPRWGKIYKFVPLLVFAYFVPAIFSNLGVIPTQSPLYGFIKKWLLPASLLLLTLSVDIPGILKLGPKVILLFLSATAGIVIGGPLAFLIVGLVWPEGIAEVGAEGWKGLAALSGSWIGGTANMVAIGESVGVRDSTFSLMVVVDVAVANVWMVFLLFFAGRDKAMDDKIGADRKDLDELREKVQAFQAENARPTSLPDLLLMLALAMGSTALATAAVESGLLPNIGSIVKGFTWVVVIVTTLGVSFSFTPLRSLDGAGASSVGSVFLYILVASIGAHAEFHRVGEVPALMLIGALWMSFHAVTILLVRRFAKAPIFFAAVGSKANIGGAASAPIVASAFHPALAPVGVLLAIGGYVLGTYAGLLCAFLLERVHGIVS